MKIPALLTKRQAFMFIGFAMLLTVVLHWPHMDKDLMGVHVWRQAQTQNTINSFFEEDFNIFNPRQNVRFGTDGIYRMEFPLMQWAIAGLYFITAEEIAVTRWVMMLIYLLTIAGFAFCCFHAFKSWLAAVVGAWAFAFSPEIYYYGINPMPDVLALCFCVWGVGWFLKFYNDQQRRSFVFSAAFIGLSALVKLPFVLFFAIPGSYLLFVKKVAFEQPTFKVQTLPLLVCVLPVVVWYAMVISGWTGNGIVGGVLESDSSLAVLAGYVMHHILSTFPELYINYAALPAFVVALFAIKKQPLLKGKLLPFFVCLLLVTLYFLFEINMIEKVHDYYLFPFYPFITLMVVCGFLKLFSTRKVFAVVALLMLLCMPLIAYLRRANSWNPDNPGFNKDLLLYKDQLRKAVPDSALVVAGNDPAQHAFLYYIHKKGWIFEGDNYDAVKLQKAINEGAEYLYCDSRNIDEESLVQSLLDKKIVGLGSIYVYRLKHK